MGHAADAVPAGVARDLYVTLPRGTSGKLTTELALDEPQVAPLARSAPLGTLTLSFDGKLIGEFGEERRAIVKMEEVPATLSRAILAAEDERFYQHRGVDYIGVARAALFNFASGGVRQGASTITMQVSGGGGYGSPLDRDLKSLQHDIRAGYISKTSAEKLYGAVFKGDTLELDIAATEARRKSMREQGLPHDEPVTEIIIPFPTSAQPPKPDPQYEKLTEEERTAFAMACRCCS